MRWESRGERELNEQVIEINFFDLFIKTSLQSGERVDVLGRLENAGIDWLVYRCQRHIGYIPGWLLYKKKADKGH